MERNYNNFFKGFFEGWEIAVAKKLVNDFIGKHACLKGENFDDLLQECFIHWAFTRKDYQPEREASQKTFMARILRNKLTDLVREKEANKRKTDRLSVSLNEPAGEDNNAPTLLDKIKEENSLDGASDPVSDLQLRIDISNPLQKLSPSQQELCRLLGKEMLTVKEAGEYLKTPRSNIYDELKRIRKIFRKEGLEKYME